MKKMFAGELHLACVMLLGAFLVSSSALADPSSTWSISPQTGLAVPLIAHSESIPFSAAVKDTLLPLAEHKKQIKDQVIKPVPVNDPSDAQLDIKVRTNLYRPAIYKIDVENQELVVDEHSFAKSEIALHDTLDAASQRIGNIDENWQAAFLARMSSMSSSQNWALSNLLVSNTDPLLDDEIAWVLSHMTVRDLVYLSSEPELIAENAQLIYERATLLNYVDIVELDGGKTTLTYWITRDDETVQWQLPEEMYYRAVVNMKMDFERVQRIDPTTGDPASAPDGIFWRPYYLDAEEPPIAYSAHDVFTLPNNLHGDQFPTLQTERDAVFADFAIGPRILVRRSSDGLPVMVEFTFGNSSYGNDDQGPDGSVLASLIAVEKLADKNLLKNMLGFLNGHAQLNRFKHTLVVKDRDPFGSATVTDTLTEMEMTYTVMDSSAFAALNANALDVYRKVIVPSDQPLALYQVLADRKSDLEGYIDRGGVLQLHGAVENDVDLWDGLVMPGGFTRQTLGTTTRDTLEEGGFYKLTEVMTATNLAWDGQRHDGIGGERKLDPETFALDKIGFFVGDLLNYNVSEYFSMHPTADRAVQPVRTAYNHFGNCGEIQDTIGAAARASLIPTLLVTDHPEDHVWNQVYLDDRWFPFQVDWSDLHTRIANPGVSYDKQQGGGKDCSCILSIEPDGTVRSVIGDYSDSITITVRITDADDRPVDGAHVQLSSETYYSSDLTACIWGPTDDNGEITFEVGEHQNYYIRVESVLGNYPEDGATQILTDTATDAGESFTWSQSLSGSMNDYWQVQSAKDELDSDGHHRVDFIVQGEYAVLKGRNSYTGDTTYQPSNTPDGVLVLLNEEQLNAYATGGQRIATEIVHGLQASFDVPVEGQWYLMLLPDAAGKDVLYSGTLSAWFADSTTDGDIDGDLDAESDALIDGDAEAVEFDSEATIDGDEDDSIQPGDQDMTPGDADLDSVSSDDSDGCRTTSSGSASLLLLALALLLVARRRNA